MKRLFVVIYLIGIIIAGVDLVDAKEVDNAAFKNYPLPSEIDTNHADGAWGEASNGLIAKIWIAKGEALLNDPIIVHYIVKNIGDKEVTIWASGFWPNHLIIVTNPSGKKITSNDLGLKFHPGVYGKNAAYSLKPGQIDSALASYDLTKLFDMQERGMYTVQYLYEEEFQDGMHWRGKLFSNILKIQIK